MATHAGIRSPKGAMRDIFVHRMDDMDKYLEAFKCVPIRKDYLFLLMGK